MVPCPHCQTPLWGNPSRCYKCHRAVSIDDRTVSQKALEVANREAEAAGLAERLAAGKARVVSVGAKRFALSTLVKCLLKESTAGTVQFLGTVLVARTAGIWFPRAQIPLLVLLSAAALLWHSLGLPVLKVLLLALIYVAVVAALGYLVFVRLPSGHWVGDMLLAIPFSVAAASILAPILTVLNPAHTLLSTGPACPSCGVEMEDRGGGVATSFTDAALGGGQVVRTGTVSWVVKKACPHCGHAESKTVARR